MAEGARIAEAAGADVIDINMGCPARHVTGGQSGSALMRDLDHAVRLIEATVDAVKVPVTLKMRLGWDERSLNAPELARRAEASGVQLISVHGRTRCQFYKGEADWRAVRAVKDAIQIPLVVNGDITSFDKAVAAIEASGADAVMVGRGAQGQPWLPGQIGRRLETGVAEAAPSLVAQLSHVRTLYDEICRHYGLRIGLRHARKHLGWALEVAAGYSRAPAAGVEELARQNSDVGRSAKRSPIASRCVRRFCVERGRMTSTAEHRQPMPSGAEIILNALPNPVLMVGPDGRIVDANMAAEAFFEISAQFLQRYSLKELVPFGSPLLALIDQVRSTIRRSTSTRSISVRPAWEAIARSTFMSRPSLSGPAISS